MFWYRTAVTDRPQLHGWITVYLTPLWPHVSDEFIFKYRNVCLRISRELLVRL
jgi:hypothetical protein